MLISQPPFKTRAIRINSFILYIMSKMVDLTSSANMELNNEEFKLINLISYSEINLLDMDEFQELFLES